MQTNNSPILYQAGTLTYDRKQLLISCASALGVRLALIMIANCLVPLLYPLLLDRAGANAAQIAILIGTVPYTLNCILCPIISTASDKTRSRWGRRTPYLLFSAPVLAGVLIAIAYSRELSNGLGMLMPGSAFNWNLLVLGILIVMFQVAYLFPGSIFCYLEVDIIPQECYGRYVAFATVLTQALNAAFGYFAVKYIGTHVKVIIWIFASAYLVIYCLQAIFAKEGTYPPVNDRLTQGGNKLRHAAEYFIMYFRQCFSHKIYIALALCSGLNTASNTCRAMFNLLFATKDLGVSMALYGKITASSGLASAGLVYFAGRLMDKTHPMLIYFVGGVLVIIVNIFGYFFALGPTSYAVVAVITALVYALQSLAGVPMLARIYPKDKFGQFSSANAMTTHLVMTVATAFAGVVTYIYGYRVMFVWDFFVTILAMSALGVVYHEWKHFGGKNYQPPSVE